MSSREITYSERTLKRDVVAPNTLDSIIGNCGLAVLEDGSDVDGLPLDGGLLSNLAIILLPFVVIR